MKQMRTKQHRGQHAALPALALLLAGCVGGEIASHAPIQDASADAAEPDASDAAVYVGPCEPGTAGPRCSPCPAGSYCPGGHTPMALCGVNAFDADQDPKTACVAASSCPAGTYVALLYSRVTDQRCANCPSGTFTADANTRSCSVARECGAAQYELRSPSSQQDRTCADFSLCEPDEFIAQPGSPTHDRVCQRTRTCHAGEYELLAPSTQHDRGCIACAPGSFSATDNASQCQRWHVCATNEFESDAPSSNHDRSCTLRSECEPWDEDAGTLPSECTTS
jgi:hypothetical protein